MGFISAPQNRSHGGFRLETDKNERFSRPGEGVSHNPRKPGGARHAEMTQLRLPFTIYPTTSLSHFIPVGFPSGNTPRLGLSAHRSNNSPSISFHFMCSGASGLHFLYVIWCRFAKIK
jgi:hypothetical protein